MGRAKEKPLFSEQTDYEDDYAQWLFEQAELLRQKRFAEIDLANLVEELESMGREQRHALRSSYRLVISHLLKWCLQPQLRTTSWQVTLVRERDNIQQRESDNPSLKAIASTLVLDAYGKAVREAALETGLPMSAFPRECPWSPDQLRQEDFLPDSLVTDAAPASGRRKLDL